MAAGEYPSSTWYGASSNNYTPANRPSSNPINKIVVHVTQGSWSSAINWFLNPSAYVSAHYTIRSSDGFIGQSVREKDIAWHAGNWSYNETSIGIEHEGYVSDPKWFTDTMYRSSAKLSAYLCNKYSIPTDRYHVIGHNEVPYPNTHTDPGYYWDWTKYMGYVREYAGVSDLINPPPILGETPPHAASPSYGVSPADANNTSVRTPYSTPSSYSAGSAPAAKRKKAKGAKKIKGWRRKIKGWRGR